VFPRKLKKAAPPPRTAVDWQAGAKTTAVTGADRIKLHVPSNPMKPGSEAAATFAKYADGMTVDEAMTAGITAEALAYDRKRGHVTLHPLPDFMRLLVMAAAA